MLMKALTYHQVMPAFLRYILPFGKQFEAIDFHTIGFRSASCVDLPNRHLQLPSLERSGRHLEICYSLKSVERSREPQPSWTIEQCSVHHRFDLETQKMSWIIVKANRVILKEIRQQRKTELSGGANAVPITPFQATLDTHRAMAWWSSENWHWYINELESTVQEGTRRTLYTPLLNTILERQRTQSPMDESPGRPDNNDQRKLRFRSISSRLRQSASRFSKRSSDSIPLAQIPQRPRRSSEERIEVAADEFSFEDLQNTQVLEDKANESLAILRADYNVIEDLRREYAALQNSPNVLDPLCAGGYTDFVQFDRDLSKVAKDLYMDLNRAEALLKLLADRKSLVSIPYGFSVSWSD